MNSLRSDDDKPTNDEERPTEAVRITGATPAGEDPLGDWNFEEPAGATELPHWTDEPTGEIPAALIRDRDESASSAPVWREESSDWQADEEPFDPIMLASDEAPLGALNPEPPVEDARPWEFDLDELPIGTAASKEPEAPEPEPEPWNSDDAPVAPATPTTPSPRRRRGGPPPVEDEDEAPRRRPERTAAPRRSRSESGGTERTGRDLPLAVITGVLIAVLVLVTFDIGTVLATCLVVVVVTLAAAEAFAAFRRAGHQPATLLGLAATLALSIGAYNRGVAAFGLVTTLLFVFTVVWFMVGVEKGDVLKGISSTMLVYIWVGVIGSYAALLLNPKLFPNRHGLAFLLAAILLVVVYDIVALFVGSSMGRRPLAPGISPNKTWEGLVGASIATILAAVILIPLMHPWTFTSALCLGVAVVILSPLGDLTESLIKRALGLKDMGRLLPGHGGLLDRVDGLLFVLPATFYLVRAFHLT
jgi:phosphatidate cytidylyltransferase